MLKRIIKFINENEEIISYFIVDNNELISTASVGSKILRLTSHRQSSYDCHVAIIVRIL